MEAYVTKGTVIRAHVIGGSVVEAHEMNLL